VAQRACVGFVALTQGAESFDDHTTEWASRIHAAERFSGKDYDLKIKYLTDHFSRMWARFDYIIGIESAIVGGKFVFGHEKLSREIAIVRWRSSVVDLICHGLRGLIFGARLLRRGQESRRSRCQIVVKHGFATLPSCR
jgi:hypothetical protein